MSTNEHNGPAEIRCGCGHGISRHNIRTGCEDRIGKAMGPKCACDLSRADVKEEHEQRVHRDEEHPRASPSEP